MAIDIRNAEGQLGFDELLIETEQVNRDRAFQKKTAGLPSTWETALPFYWKLLHEHHRLMMSADVEAVMALREQAYDLAYKLNDCNPGILANENSSGRKLCRETQAATGEVPLWGQAGDFNIELDGMLIRIEMQGIFGIGGKYAFWPGFGAHAVHKDKPFISETGYRSFLGVGMESITGLTPETFAHHAITVFLS